MDADARLGFNRGLDEARELDAVDGQRVARGHGARVGALQQRRAGAAHLLLEEPRGGVFALGFEGVRADELAEVGGLVRRGGADGAHLVEIDFEAEAREGEGRFGSGQASADDANLHAVASVAASVEAASAARAAPVTRMRRQSSSMMASRLR